MQNKAVGSVWNANSWHWEMKNYTNLAKKLVEEKLLGDTIEINKDIKLTHKKVTFSKADAEINIRKGKPIFVYEFEVEIEFEGENINDEHCEGSYRAKEILNNLLDDIIIDQIKVKDKNKTADQAKKWIKKSAKDYLTKIFNHLQEEVIKHQSDPKKLEEDKKLREENLQATQKAREENGAEKERLLAEQKEKEKALKEEAQIKNLENLTGKKSQ